MHLRLFVIAACGVALTACLGPNPLLGEDDSGDSDTSDPTGDGDDGDGDGDPTGDGDGDDTGDGDGDPTGDGDGDDGCSNTTQDGDETDVDCGGSCLPCAPGDTCLEPSDCDSGICDEGLCAAPSCSDDIANGDELDVDCGGSCRFCEHSIYVDEFDDFEGSDSFSPNVAMFDDGVFAISYIALVNAETRVRWFDDQASPLGAGEVVAPEITNTVLASQGMAATDDVDAHSVYMIFNGEDAMSTSKDVFAVSHALGVSGDITPIYQGPTAVSYADLILDGAIASFVWEEGGRIYFRRYDFELNGGDWVDVPQTANDEFALRPGKHPTLARRGGVTIVTWIACDAMMLDACDVELRSFDGSWVEGAPVALGLDPQPLSYPQVAIASDDRVAVTWTRADFNDKEVWAAILDANLALDGAWMLQGGLATPFTPTTDVVALQDDSFAIAWPDDLSNRVHIRRFIGPDSPLVTDVGDEAPWPTGDLPFWVRLSTADNLVVVIWSGRSDNVYQIQGQVLSY